MASQGSAGSQASGASAQRDEAERRADGRGRPRPGPALWGLIGAGVCGLMIQLEPNLLEEGFLVHAAQRLVAGEQLYRDIASFTGPLPFELLALCFRIFGEEIVVARCAVAAFHGLACAALYALARRGGGGALAHAVVGAYASAPILLFPLYSVFFYSTLAVHISILAAYATERALRSPAWAGTAGVAIACVALCKQTVGVVLAVGLLASVLALSPSESRIRRVLGMVGGGAAMALLTLLVFAQRGDLEPLLRWLIVLPLSIGDTFDSAYMNLWPLGRFSYELRPHQAFYLPNLHALLYGIVLRDVSSVLVLLTQFLHALPFLALIATAVAGFKGRLRAAIWIHTALLVALIGNLFPRSDWGHLVFALPAALGQLLLLLPGRDFARRIVAASVLVVLVCGAGWTGVKLHALSGPPSFGPKVPQLPVNSVYRGPGLPKVVRYLRENTHPGEPIFVARAEPLIYFATETSNPTPFGGVIPGLREEQEPKIIEALEQVRFVVMSDIDQPFFMYYRDELPGVQAYFERHFLLPNAFRGRGSSWISVLERGPDRGATQVDLFERAEQARRFIRTRAGTLAPPPEEPPVLATRHNRRPLPFWLGPRGGGLEFEVDLPQAAAFQADLGLVVAVGLRSVYWHPRSKLRVALRSRGTFRTLAERPVLERDFEGRDWSPFEVDLSAWSGQRVTLRLEMTGSQVFKPGALAWLGSPRIISRQASGR